MTKESYQKIFRIVRSFPNGVVLLQMMNKMLTFAAAFCYIMSILVLGIQREWKGAAILILVPAVSFVAVSIFRSRYNAKRPYEKYGFIPLIPKNTQGKSFPSRHVFSIFVIGSTVLWFFPVAGVVICLFGILLALLRIIVGVHFPKDVIAGALFGILCGVLAKMLLGM